MAITHTETQITWSASSSVSVTAGSNQTSDEFNIDDTCIRARIQIKADNSTTPASDDIIMAWLLETMGDPDGASTDEFTTVLHAVFLGQLDTSTEDPAQIAIDLPLPQKGCKLYVEGATYGTTNSITMSATVIEQRAA